MNVVLGKGVNISTHRGKVQLGATQGSCSPNRRHARSLRNSAVDGRSSVGGGCAVTSHVSSTPYPYKHTGFEHARSHALIDATRVYTRQGLRSPTPYTSTDRMPNVSDAMRVHDPPHRAYALSRASAARNAARHASLTDANNLCKHLLA